MDSAQVGEIILPITNRHRAAVERGAAWLFARRLGSD